MDNTRRFNFDPMLLKHSCDHSGYLYFPSGSTSQQAFTKIDEFRAVKCAPCAAVADARMREVVRLDCIRIYG